MNVQDAVATRRSVRDFLDTPVPGDVIRRVVEQALRAPSGGNLQPWHLHLVGGDRLTELKTIMRTRVDEAPAGEGSEYDVYPRELVAPYRDRRFAVGEAMYARLGIPREDKRRGAMVRAQLPVLRRTARAVLHGRPPHGAAAVVRPGNDAAESDAAAARRRPRQLPAGMLGTVPADHRQLHRHPARTHAVHRHGVGYADRSGPIDGLVTERAPLSEVAEFDGI